MSGITLHGCHQLGYEVVALLELHVDVGKSVLAVVAQLDEVVVDAGNEQAEHNHNCNDDKSR